MTVDPTEPTDLELRAQFAALRERELTAAPEFELVLARATARETLPRHPAVSRAARAAVVGTAVAAIAAIAVWLVPGPLPTTSAPDSLALPGWRTPTDSLLAYAADPSTGASWTTLPTAALGQPLFHPVPETRR